MLPNTLYKSLPYLYIVTGVFCGLTIDSNIVLVSSALLMLGGFLVLWMRHHPSRYSSIKSASESNSIKARNWNAVFQAEQERRLLGIARSFPLIDNNGNMVAFDRRVGERRISNAA